MTSLERAHEIYEAIVKRNLCASIRACRGTWQPDFERIREDCLFEVDRILPHAGDTRAIELARALVISHEFEGGRYA